MRRLQPTNVTGPSHGAVYGLNTYTQVPKVNPYPFTTTSSHLLSLLTMKFSFFATTLATAAVFLTGVRAQSISIGSPLPGDAVSRGQNLTVEVDKPVRLSLFWLIMV